MSTRDFDDEEDGPEPEIHAEPDAPPAQPGVPRLTLHVDLPDLNPEVIRRAVIEAALNQYVVQQTFVTVRRRKFVQAKDGNGNHVGDPMPVEFEEQVPGPAAFRDVVKDQIAKEMAELVQPHIRAIMEAQVAEILAGEIQATTQWGEAKGPKVSIREFMRSTLEDFMREKVDQSGRTGSGGRTRLEWGIVAASSEVFNQHFKPLVEAEVKAIKASLGGQIKDSIASAVLQHLGLKLG